MFSTAEYMGVCARNDPKFNSCLSDKLKNLFVDMKDGKLTNAFYENLSAFCLISPIIIIIIKYFDKFLMEKY